MRMDRSVLQKLARPGLFAPVKLRCSLSELFHENTKLAPLSARAYSRWIEAFIRSRKVREMVTRPYKDYTLMDQVGLPEAPPRGELCQTIARRRSLRRFTGAPATLGELSQLLLYSYGRTDPGSHFRAVASGGALYPLEVYVVALRIEGLEPGIYHYAAEDHHLDVVERGDFLRPMETLVMTTGIEVAQAAMVVVFTAVFRRSTFKYQDRGYRMVLLEAGAAAHGLSLVANSLGLGDCHIGGFLDDALSELLEIDGLEEAPLLPVVLGRRPAGASEEGEEC
jgi:SagB-type dehydrogenase family enzyme